MLTQDSRSIRPGVYAGFEGQRVSSLAALFVCLSAAFTRLMAGGKSPVNRADKTRQSPFVQPGVNAGPKTAFGGKPDESGCTRFPNAPSCQYLRLIERY